MLKINTKMLQQAINKRHIILFRPIKNYISKYLDL